MNSSTAEDTIVEKIIGTVTRYNGTEHPYLVGRKIRIVAVLRGAADPDVDPDDVEILRSDEEVEAAGGVTARDRVEVVPWIDGGEGGHWSFVTSDPLAVDCDLELTAHR